MDKHSVSTGRGASGMGTRLRSLLLVASIAVASWSSVSCHEGHGADTPHCDTEGSTLGAYYVPGEITVDGDAMDWIGISGSEFQMLQAINPNPEQHYPPGSDAVTVKAAHDGQSIYILLQVPGAYMYSTADGHLAPAVALMFGIGDDATFYNMGGCANLAGKCTAENCRGHEVDLVQFKVNTAIPGRQYGANLADNVKGTGKDSIGQLDDMFAWNPHCRGYDGPSTVPGATAAAVGSQNDWRGAWSHTSIDMDYGLVATDAPYGSAGDPGDFVFEFSRPLRTSDRAQQDVQMAIGPLKPVRFGAALWYPVDNTTAWSPHQHYVLTCDWIQLELLSATEPGSTFFSALSQGGGSGSSALSVISVLVAIAALAVSLVTGWWVRTHPRQFTPMEISM